MRNALLGPEGACLCSVHSRCHEWNRRYQLKLGKELAWSEGYILSQQAKHEEEVRADRAQLAAEQSANERSALEMFGDDAAKLAEARREAAGVHAAAATTRSRTALHIPCVCVRAQRPRAATRRSWKKRT